MTWSLFACAYLSSVSHLWGRVCSNFCPTFFSFLLSFENSLSVFDTSPLSDTRLAKIFLLVHGLSFSSFKSVLKNRCFNFYEANVLICPSVDHAFGKTFATLFQHLKGFLWLFFSSRFYSFGFHI